MGVTGVSGGGGGAAVTGRAVGGLVDEIGVRVTGIGIDRFTCPVRPAGALGLIR